MEESGETGQGRGLAAGWQSLIAFAISGFLYALSFPPFNLPEAAYVFAIPVILWGIFGKSSRHEAKLLLACGWATWFVLIIWLRNCTSSLDMPLKGALGWGLTAAMSFLLGLFWLAWSWVALRLVRAYCRRPFHLRITVLLGLAAWWVVLEWLRSVLFTGFPWLPLSVSQWQRPLLLQIASITGGYGISFILIAFNLGLGFYLRILWEHRRATFLKRLSAEFYLALALLLGAVGYGLQSAGNTPRNRIEGPRLGFVQPDVSPVLKWDMQLFQENLDTLSDLSTYASYLEPDLILWPEAPTPLPVKGNADMQAWVEGLSRHLDTPLLIGNVAREEAPDTSGHLWYNAVFLVDPESGVETRDYYIKRHLVPFGEYIPLSGWLPFISKFVPIEANLGRGHSARVLTPPPALEGSGRIGNLICYEDVYPALARENTKAGASWHYVATNNTWFGEESGAWQHAAHSVLRAVETRRPVVRCGNAGWSGWIDEFGNIRHVVTDKNGSIYFQGVDAVDFYRNRWWSNRLSPYVQYGDWMVWLSMALLAGAVIVFRIPWKR